LALQSLNVFAVSRLRAFPVQTAGSPDQHGHHESGPDGQRDDHQMCHLLIM
jgi:hypothetical protein